MRRTLRKEKEEVKKTIRPKKADADFVVSGVKVRTPRKATKKVIDKKALSRANDLAAEVVLMPEVLVPEKTVRSRTPRTKTKAMTPPENPKKEVVFVPSTASLRLLEKIEIYRLWYRDNFPTYMAETAKVGGYTFILLGTLFASFSYLANKDLFVPAATICTEVDCTEVADNELPPSAPLVTFLNSLPTELTTDTDFVLRAENTSEPKVLLHHVETGERIALAPIDTMDGGEFKYLIRSDLKSGTYIVQAEARDGATTYKFSGPTITVPGTVAVAVPTVLPSSTETQLATTTASSSVVTEVGVESIQTTTETPAPRTLRPLAVEVVATTDATYLRINVGDFAPEVVEVYSRLVGSNEAIFLGLATQVQGEWILSLSALDLPHYEHQLYASFIVHGKTYQTEAASFVPVDLGNASLTSETELSLLVQKIELALATSDVKNSTRLQYFSYIASTTPAFFDAAHEVVFTNNVLLAEADEQMRLNDKSIDTLLGYYAAAVQGGQKYLLDLVDTKLVSQYKLIARASDVSENTTALETLYALRFQALKDRVRDMEQLVGDETNTLTARDTDKDGFSDFDEIANYLTDPAKADTDKDGVLDSVEIISGFNPLASDIRTLPALFQNIDERVFADVLQIRGAHAVTQKTGEMDKTYAVINGTSIPNSYVTILAYTAGTIGVIRTNTDGEFSYTVEKELIEGEYEVVAVLTDNEGSVVAASKPFFFTKTKNALVAAAAVGDVTTISEKSSTNEALPAVVTASVAVAAFGFILLLLSQTLVKCRREPVVKTTLKPLGS